MPINFKRGGIGTKPGPGASINGAHPLAQNLVGAWLFNEFAGTRVSSLITNQDNLSFISGNWVAGQPYGTILVDSFSGAGLKLVSPSSLLKPTTQVSVHIRGAETGQATGSSNCAVVSMQFTNSNTSPFWAYGIHRDTTDQTGCYWLDDTSATSNNIHSAGCFNGGASPAGAPFSATLAYDGVNINGYFKGILKATHARTGTLSYGTPQLDISSDFSSDTAKIASDVIYIWNRGLKASEVEWLHYEPYALIDTKKPKLSIFFGNPTVTTSKTQTGKANIRVTTTKTLTGKSRIQKTDTQTQTGVANIRNSGTKIQIGKANIRNAGTKNQTGKSAIQKTTTQTQFGVSDIQVTSLQTQTGKSFINKETTQTQTGKAAIQKTTLRTQTGKARIQLTDTQIQTGKARIQLTGTQIQFGVSDIQVTSLQTQTGVKNDTKDAKWKSIDSSYSFKNTNRKIFY